MEIEEGSSGSAESSGGSDDEVEEGWGEEGSGEMAVQVKEFFSELNIDEGKQKKRLLDFGFRVPRRKSVLPHHLHSVMGSANLRLARGDTSGAIELCKEIIRQAPQASEPYLTLATIYEELEDEKKLFQILLIAAHLKRNDQDLWLKCAALAKKQMNLHVASQCLSKAIMIEPKNIKLIWERASLYGEMGDNKRAIDSYEQILKLLPQNAGCRYVEITKELATLYHEVNNTPKAVEILGRVLVTHPELVDEEIINILAELCIISKAYEQIYEVITGFYHMVPQPVAPSENDNCLPSLDAPVNLDDVSLTTALRISISGDDMELGSDTMPCGEVAAEQEKSEDTLILPDEMPVDLRVKLALAMIHLGKKFPEKLLEPIFSSPEDYGDLFLDIADAYISNAEYRAALPLLSALVGTSRYSQAGVWLKHAECQHMLNDLEGACMSYSKVLSLVPHHTDTRLQLATLYVQMGNTEDALMVLESDPNPDRTQEDESVEATHMISISEVDSFVNQVETGLDMSDKESSTQDVRLTIHKYKLLLSSGKLKEYVHAGCSLLAFLFRDIYKHPEIKVLIKLKIKKKKIFRNLVGTDSRKPGEDMEIEKLLSPPDWFNLYQETCTGLLRIGTASCHYRIIYLIYCAAINNKFSGDLEKPFIFFAASLSHILKDHGTTFMLLRDLCFKDAGDTHLWNIINVLPLDDIKRKFMLRLCQKNANPYIMRILANCSLTSASVNSRFCLSQFEKEFREGGHKDYLLSLCIAIVYINYASQVKNPPNRNGVITMASGFLHNYVQLRGECQESMYNMGRGFHQLGIVHIACHFYKKVLMMEPECRLPEWSKASDLRSEAALNLSLIYKNSGNTALARDILQKYCTV